MGEDFHTVVAVDAGGGRPPDGPKLWLSDLARGLFAVASPLGTSTRGASFLLDALEMSHEPDTRQSNASIEDPEAAWLRRVILAAQKDWAAAVEGEPRLKGVGATASVVTLAHGYAVVGHLGDCRVHQIRNNRLLRRTQDHLQPARDVTRGREVNVLVRGFGMDSNPEIRIWDTRPDDIFLLSSGFCGVLTDDEIVFQFASPNSCKMAIETLVALAAGRRATEWIAAVAVRPQFGPGLTPVCS